MTTPEPMAMQWSQVDDLVGNYVQHLRDQPTTTSDIALDLLTTDKQISDYIAKLEGAA